MKRSALFLDRDGVINFDKGYVYEQTDFEFIDGIFELCRTARELDYMIFVVTNQSGIARGYYTEEDFFKLTDWMCKVFVKNGASIDKVYFCPFHPEYGMGKYRVDSPLRKPGPGMIQKAATEFGIDLATSVMVGDKKTDIQAGIAAGVACNLIYLPLCSREFDATIGAGVVRDLADVSIILRRKLSWRGMNDC